MLISVRMRAGVMFSAIVCAAGFAAGPSRTAHASPAYGSGFIAYGPNTGTGASAGWTVVDVATRETHTVTPTGDGFNGVVENLRYSPDGRRVAFVSGVCGWRPRTAPKLTLSRTSIRRGSPGRQMGRGFCSGHTASNPCRPMAAVRRLRPSPTHVAHLPKPPLGATFSTLGNAQRRKHHRLPSTDPATRHPRSFPRPSVPSRPMGPTSHGSPAPARPIGSLPSARSGGTTRVRRSQRSRAFMSAPWPLDHLAAWPSPTKRAASGPTATTSRSSVILRSRPLRTSEEGPAPCPAS